MKRFWSLLFFLFTFHFSLNSFASDSSLKLGYEAFLTKDYATTLSLLKGSGVSKNSPLLDYYLWALGKSQIESGDYDGGLKNLEELIRVEPQSLFVSQAKANVGKALQMKGDNTRAKEFLKAQIPTFPDEAKAEKGQALYYLGLAETQLGEKEAGLSHIKEAYLQYPAFAESKDAAAKLQELGAASFSSQDLMTRADRLFEAKSYAEAAKAYEELMQGDPSQKNLASAQKGECLYQMKRNGDSEIYLAAAGGAGVPSEVAKRALLHLGILQQKSGSQSQAMVAFERVRKNFPGTVEGEEALYRMGAMALDDGRDGEANQFFQKLSEEYPHGNFRDKGLWSAGWTAYMAHDWTTALKNWGELEKGATDAPTLGKAIYWEARVLEKQGDSKKAASEFSRAAQSSPFSYYGFMALKWAKGSKEVSETPEVPTSWRSESLPKMGAAVSSSSPSPRGGEGRSDLHFQKAVALYAISLGKPIASELAASVRENENNPSGLLRLLEASKKTEAYSIPVQFGQKYWDSFKKIFPDPTSAEQFRASFQFPFAFRSLVQRAAADSGIPASLIVGLMRQESAFQPWITSSANAQGLMQMLPATARMRAKAIGESVGDLLDPAANIRLGTAELKALLDRFGGNWVYAIAGYNAGPGRPPQWAAQNGNLETDEFIEAIPFSETNLYVKLVLRNYWAYKTLYR